MRSESGRREIEVKPNGWTASEEIEWRRQQQARNEAIARFFLERVERRENVKKFTGEPVTDYSVPVDFAESK
jgi:hypothetical protein